MELPAAVAVAALHHCNGPSRQVFAYKSEPVCSVAAEGLISPDEHSGRKCDLTNDELLTFEKMSNIMSGILGREISYNSPNLLAFYLTKRKENVASTYILVMIMLHFLPRFQKQPSLSGWVEKLTSKNHAAL